MCKQVFTEHDEGDEQPTAAKFTSNGAVLEGRDLKKQVLGYGEPHGRHR